MHTILRFVLAAALVVFPIVAEAQAAATLCDEAALTTDATFQNRVRQEVLTTCTAIASENATTTPFHIKRNNLCASIVAAPDSFKPLFTDAVATDATVGTDATTAGTLCGASSTTIATQAASVTDAHIANAVSSQFNTFLTQP